MKSMSRVFLSGLVVIGMLFSSAASAQNVSNDVQQFKDSLAKRGQGGTAMASQDPIDRALEELKQEPTVREVQEAALRNFQVNTDQVDSMRSRAAIKALAPVLEVSGGYSVSDTYELSENFAENYYLGGGANKPWITRGADGDAYDVRGKLAWNLPQLIFNAEELDVASLAGLVEGLLKESTRLFFMRRRLQVEMILTPPTNRETMLTKELRLEELTGLIDAMTGGWFQRELERREARASGAPSANR